MRHVRSILYALVLAPAVWVLAGVGFTHDLTSRGRDFFTAESLSGLLLLVFAGILYAIMTFSPISPLGPTLAGAAFLGVTYWAWSGPESYAASWSPDVVKDGFDLSRPGYGLAALLAVPLLCTMLSARRWARYEPPVLPIIGEIGRFRGSAKVAGVNVAAEETTVFKAAQRPADQTVALRTQVLPTPAAARPAPSAPPAGPLVTAASDDTTTIFAAAPKASTPPSSAPEAPKSNKSGITANPTITSDAGKIAAQPAGDSDRTVAMKLPPEDKTTVIPAAQDKTTVLPAVTDKTTAAADRTTVLTTAADETTVLPAVKDSGADEPTTVLPASDLVKPPVS